MNSEAKRLPEDIQTIRLATATMQYVLCIIDFVEQVKSVSINVCNTDISKI